MKESIENAEEQEETIEAGDVLDDEDLNILEVINDDEKEDDQESNLQAQLKTAKSFIKSEKEKQKENRDKVQPKIFLGVGFYDFQSGVILHFVSYKLDVRKYFITFHSLVLRFEEGGEVNLHFFTNFFTLYDIT